MKYQSRPRPSRLAPKKKTDDSWLARAITESPFLPLREQEDKKNNRTKEEKKIIKRKRTKPRSLPSPLNRRRAKETNIVEERKKKRKKNGLASSAIFFFGGLDHLKSCGGEKRGNKNSGGERVPSEPVENCETCGMAAEDHVLRGKKPPRPRVKDCENAIKDARMNSQTER
ncbi:hypothetical protein CEXT_157231 [Caerostris extrusa]|uniref:Uncharacterized protein n=1 Tax=Caerostris extrusa TaxID=172846 RepID=A0AAV4XZT0_CAEEX|nr:hypothetical protein CEXT_157231 [Caerostris extrusa]